MRSSTVILPNPSPSPNAEANVDLGQSDLSRSYITATSADGHDGEYDNVDVEDDLSATNVSECTGLLSPRSETSSFVDLLDAATSGAGTSRTSGTSGTSGRGGSDDEDEDEFDFVDETDEEI